MTSVGKVGLCGQRRSGFVHVGGLSTVAVSVSRSAGKGL